MGFAISPNARYRGLWIPRSISSCSIRHLDGEKRYYIMFQPQFVGRRKKAALFPERPFGH
jgi:hypothetical protein